MSQIESHAKACPNCKFVYELQSLSPAEIEVLRLKLRGLTGVQIGEILFKAPTTICTYWWRIKEKLGVSSVQQVHQLWASRRMLTVPEMDETHEFRAGYARALADFITPDLEVFRE